MKTPPLMFIAPDNVTALSVSRAIEKKKLSDEHLVIELDGDQPTPVSTSKDIADFMEDGA